MALGNGKRKTVETHYSNMAKTSMIGEGKQLYGINQHLQPLGKKDSKLANVPGKMTPNQKRNGTDSCNKRGQKNENTFKRKQEQNMVRS